MKFGAEYDNDGVQLLPHEQQYLAEFMAIWKRRESDEITQEHCEYLMAAHECAYEAAHGGIGAAVRLRDRVMPHEHEQAVPAPSGPTVEDFVKWSKEQTGEQP